MGDERKGDVNDNVKTAAVFIEQNTIYACFTLPPKG